MRWALSGIAGDHLTVSRVAGGLSVSWNTADTAVLADGEKALIDNPTRFHEVRVFRDDERVWRLTQGPLETLTMETLPKGAD